MDPVIIIYNPVSGSGRATKLASAVEKAFGSLQVPARLEPTKAAGDGTNIARQWDGKSRALMAVGGDGTIAEVVKGMDKHLSPLAVLPAGTSNVLALELKLPTDPMGAAQTVVRGVTRQLDLMATTQPGCPPSQCLLFASAGFDADAVHRLANLRTQNIKQGGKGTISKLTYLKPVIQAWRGLDQPSLEIEVDGSPLSGGPWGWAVVTSVSAYAGYFSFGSAILPDDGLLDVVAFRTRGLWDLIRYTGAGLLGNMVDLHDCRHCQVRQTVTISAPGKLPVQMDGDPAGFTPLTIQRQETKVAVLVPPKKGAS